MAEQRHSGLRGLSAKQIQSIIGKLITIEEHEVSICILPSALMHKVADTSTAGKAVLVCTFQALCDGVLKPILYIAYNATEWTQKKAM